MKLFMFVQVISLVCFKRAFLTFFILVTLPITYIKARRVIKDLSHLEYLSSSVGPTLNFFINFSVDFQVATFMGFKGT